MRRAPRISSLFVSPAGSRVTVVAVCAVSVWVAASLHARRLLDPPGPAPLFRGCTQVGHGPAMTPEKAAESLTTMRAASAGKNVTWSIVKPSQVKVLDLNGDGCPDLVVREDSGGESQLKTYLGTGGAIFVPWRTLDYPHPTTHLVTSVDADGLASVVVAAGDIAANGANAVKPVLIDYTAPFVTGSSGGPVTIQIPVTPTRIAGVSPEMESALRAARAALGRADRPLDSEPVLGIVGPDASGRQTLVTISALAIRQAEAGGSPGVPPSTPLDFTPTSITIGPIGTDGAGTPPRLAVFLGTPAGVTVYAPVTSAGLVTPTPTGANVPRVNPDAGAASPFTVTALGGAPSPTRIAVTIEAQPDGTWVPRVVSLGTGELAVTSTQAQTSSHQNEIVIRDQFLLPPADLVALPIGPSLKFPRYAPRPTDTFRRSLRGLVVPPAITELNLPPEPFTDRFVISSGPTPEGASVHISTFVIPHILDASGTITKISTIDTTGFAPYLPGTSGWAGVFAGLPPVTLNGGSTDSMRVIVPSGNEGLTVGTIQGDRITQTPLTIDSSPSAIDEAKRHVYLEYLFRHAFDGSTPVTVGSVDAGIRQPSEVPYEDWDWGSQAIGSTFVPEISVSNGCSWPQQIHLDTSRWIGVQVQMDHAVTVPGGATVNLPIRVATVASPGGSAWIDFSHPPSVNGNEACPASRRRIAVRLSVGPSGTGGVNIVPRFHFDLTAAPRPAVPGQDAADASNHAFADLYRQAVDPGSIYDSAHASVNRPGFLAYLAQVPPTVSAGGTYVHTLDVSAIRGLVGQPTAATTFIDAITGLPDVAITGGSPPGLPDFSQIVVARNDGTNAFGDPGQFRQFIAPPGINWLGHGDFNGDGRDDLVFLDSRSHLVGLALNDGKNSFVNFQFVRTSTFLPVVGAVSDVNGDGHPDVIVGLQDTSGGPGTERPIVFTVFDGDGAGNLTPSGQLFETPFLDSGGVSLIGGRQGLLSTASGLADTRPIVDFNNDGFPDFAVTGSATAGGPVRPTVTLFLNDPSRPGNFVAQNPIPLSDSSSDRYTLTSLSGTSLSIPRSGSSREMAFVSVQLTDALGNSQAVSGSQIAQGAGSGGGLTVSGGMASRSISSASISSALMDDGTIVQVGGGAATSPQLVVSAVPLVDLGQTGLFVVANTQAGRVPLSVYSPTNRIDTFVPVDAVPPPAKPPQPQFGLTDAVGNVTPASGSGTASGVPASGIPDLGADSDPFAGETSFCCEIRIQDLVLHVTIPIKAAPKPGTESESWASRVRNFFEWLLPSGSIEAESAFRRTTPHVGGSRDLDQGNKQSPAAQANSVIAVLTSNGQSQGEAMSLQLINQTSQPVQLNADGVVVEPLKVTAAPQAQQRLQKLVGDKLKTAASLPVEAYCVAHDLAPPVAGMFYRVAPADKQARYKPMRALLNAADRLNAAGQLHPDSEPKGYLESIKQYAVWANLQHWDEGGFTQAWIDRTKKTAAALKRPWTNAMDNTLKGAAPGRWRDIQAIETAAAQGR